MSLDAAQAQAGSRLDELARNVHASIIDSADVLERDDNHALRARVESASPLLTGDEVDAVATRVSQQLFGLGPLEPLLADVTVTELMVNGPGRVWIERAGKLAPTDVTLDEATLGVIIDRIVAPLGLRVDRTSPFVDARLPDGSRVNVAVPPLAIDGPYVTVRRFPERPFTLMNFCSHTAAKLLAAAVRMRMSMLISGGTGSGKTSLLNALGAQIGDRERVITIEDAAELQLPGDHIVRLEARPANAEGVGAVPVRLLVRNALRMRPDRLIIGEVRGAEAFDMMQAMNTGHDGSMSTCHANSPVDALRRVEAMVMMSDVDLPAHVVAEHLRSAVDLVVHVERREDGRRLVASVYRCPAQSEGRHVESSQTGKPEPDRWLVREGECTAAGCHWLETAGATGV